MRLSRRFHQVAEYQLCIGRCANTCLIAKRAYLGDMAYWLIVEEKLHGRIANGSKGLMPPPAHLVNECCNFPSAPYTSLRKLYALLIVP